MALLKGYKANFETLKRAFENGDVALLEVLRVADGAVVAAVCAAQRGDDDVTFIPFAIMVEGDPYELFRPPNPDGGFFPVEPR